MKNKSKEEKQIDKAIERLFNKKFQEHGGSMYEMFDVGFKAGIEYQKNLVTTDSDPLKEMEKQETFQEMMERTQGVFMFPSNIKGTIVMDHLPMYNNLEDLEDLPANENVIQQSIEKFPDFGYGVYKEDEHK